MPRIYDYQFQRFDGPTPTPCSVCENSDGAFHVRVMLGDGLATAVCDQCASDIVAAFKARKLQSVA